MDLVNQVRQKDRDVMREASLAGQVYVYENLMHELERFSQESLTRALG
jgi:hypothetical protein